jgi:hypothetical protein
MKSTEVPSKAWDALPTPIPMKVVYDWSAMLAILKKRNFVVIESDEIRITKNGSEECIPVKAFNCYVRLTMKQQLRTKRLSQTRWFCTL